MTAHSLASGGLPTLESRKKTIIFTTALHYRMYSNYRRTALFFGHRKKFKFPIVAAKYSKINKAGYVKIKKIHVSLTK
jgi:hypothetical protein